MRRTWNRKYLSFAFMALLGHLVLPSGLKWLSIQAAERMEADPGSAVPWRVLSDTLDFDSVIASIVCLGAVVVFLLMSCTTQKD